MGAHKVREATAPRPCMAARPPSLLLFYHVPKTGGSTMREWLLRNAGIRASGLPKRLDGYVRYYEAHCFMCLQFGSLFADTATCRKHVKECSKQYGSSKPAVKVSTTSRSYGM